MATTTFRGIAPYIYTGNDAGINHTGWTSFAVTAGGRTSGYRSIDAYLTGVYVDVISISSATKITIGVTSDSAGEKALVPDTVTDITLGKATSVKGSAIMQVNIGVVSSVEPFYVWLKTDAGTCTVTGVTATFG
jgi:hypothetical protein